MSGYQIPNNVPNFFIPNGQTEILTTQVGFLQNGFWNPTEQLASSGATGLVIAASQVLSGMVTMTGANIGSAYNAILPTGIALYNALQAKVYGQQSILVNPNPSNTSGSILANPNQSITRQEFLQITPGFSATCYFYNNAGGAATFIVTPGDSTLSLNAGGDTAIPSQGVGIITFVCKTAGTMCAVIQA